MKRRNIYSDPKSLNTKISSIIRKTINLTRCLICFTDIGFYPTNIFIFATESLQFRYVYVFGDKRGHMWVEDRISKSKNNNRVAAISCHTEIHIPVFYPVNFLEENKNSFPVVDQFVIHLSDIRAIKMSTLYMKNRISCKF